MIKSVTYRATELGTEVIGIRRGWEGLTHLKPGDGLDPEYLRPLDRTSTRTIDRTGGTVLHTSRTNPRRIKREALPAWLDTAAADALRTGEDTYDLTSIVTANIKALGIDALVPIGGDDTLSFARVLVDQGVPLVAIPKTMDNDVPGTEYCIGFSSAITRAKELVDRQRTTLGSHERIGVFRIFGRDAGFSALFAAYVTSARCLIPEAPYDLDALAAVLAEDHRLSPSHYAIVIAAEGAVWEGATVTEVGESDAFGHRHKANIGEALASELGRRIGVECLAIELTYDLQAASRTRSTRSSRRRSPTSPWTSLADGAYGRMVAIRDGKYASTSLLETAARPAGWTSTPCTTASGSCPRYDGGRRPLLLLVAGRLSHEAVAAS